MPTAWLRTPSAGRDALLLTLAVAAIHLLTGDHLPLSSSTRYVEACREMVETGDWVVPHLGYVPYLEKPPLTYWLGALAQWAFGPHPLAWSLPSVLATLVSALATYALGSDLRGRRFGLAAAFLFLGLAPVLGMATVLITDTVLAACLAVCWLGWWRWEASGRTSRWIWGFWIGLGFGLLAKGPVAIAIAGMAIAGYALRSGGPKAVFTTLWAMHPLRGLLVLLALNLPWSWAVWQRDPRFLEFFYIRYNLGAFLSDKVNHPEPLWYYLPLLPAYLAPFTLVALPALAAGCWSALRARAAGPDLRRYLACAVLFPLLFLSLSTSKLGTYLLPLVPIFALVVGDVLWSWSDLETAPRRPWWSWLWTAQAVLLVPALVIAPWLAPIPWNEFGREALPWGAAGVAFLVAGFAASGVLAWRKRLLPALAATGVGLLLAAACALPNLTALVPGYDEADLMRTVRQRAGADDRVYLHQEVVHDYELDFAFGRRLPIVGNARERGMGHLAETLPHDMPFPDDTYRISGETLPANPWLWSFDRFLDAWKGPGRVWIVCEKDLPRRLRKQGVEFHQIARARNTFLLSNRP